MIQLRKTKNTWSTFACLFAAAIFSIYLISCSKDDENNPVDQSDEIGYLPGLGNTEGTPTGTPFRLPDGISLVGGMTGGACDQADHIIGSGLLVTVCFELKNDTDKEIPVTFPAGLILLSGTDKYQHGVILRGETIRIPAHQTVRITLYTYCGNSSRSGADSEASYTFGPISNSKLIARLANDVAKKKIMAIDYWDEAEGTVSLDYIFEQTNVQKLLWLITEPRDLDWESFETQYLEELSKIPE